MKPKEKQTQSMHSTWTGKKKFNSMLKRWNIRMRHKQDAFFFRAIFLVLTSISECKTQKFGLNLNEKGVKAVDIYATLQCKLNRWALRNFAKTERKKNR